jgi:hypothetical protein
VVTERRNVLSPHVQLSHDKRQPAQPQPDDRLTYDPIHFQIHIRSSFKHVGGKG